MTFGTSHLLIGVWGYFQGEGQEKILLCKGGHYIKKKNIRGCVCQLNLITKKSLIAKMRKKCQKLSNIEKFCLARFAHSAFYKIYISGAANRHVPVQCAKYVVFLFFFYAVIIRTIYFICIIFVKNINIYCLILTVNHQGS